MKCFRPWNCQILPLLLAVGISCGGCSQPADRNLPLAGSVTFAGRPLAEGTLTLSSPTGKVASAPIKDGQFSIAAERGLPFGSYQVSVMSYESTGRMIPSSDFPGQQTEEKRQIIPARYNDSSELTVTIDSANHQQIAIDLPNI